MRIAQRERLLLVIFGLLSALGGLLVLREAGVLPATLRWFTGLLLLVTGIVVVWVAFLPSPSERPPAFILLATERLSLFPLVLVGLAVLWTGLSSGALALGLRIALGLVAGTLTVLLMASIATGTRLLPDLVGEARLRQRQAAAPPGAPPAPRPDPLPAPASETYDEGGDWP
jgi:hypothetical protein